MEFEPKVLPRGREIGRFPLVAITLGELSIMQYVDAAQIDIEQPTPPLESLAALDAVTRNCETSEAVTHHIANKYGLIVRTVRDKLSEAVSIYGAATLEQATNIALVRGDISMRRPKVYMSRPLPELGNILEDVAVGLTTPQIAEKYSINEAVVGWRYGELMKHYGNACNMSTVLRRARESGHWPVVTDRSIRTFAGIAMGHTAAWPRPLSPARLDVVQDRSEGLSNAESGIRRSRAEDTQKTHLARAYGEYDAGSASELISKAIIRNMLKINTFDGPPLTLRQKAVGCGVALGLTNAEIGAQLGVSEDTATGNVGELFSTLDVKGREQLTRRLYEGEYLVVSRMPPRPLTAPYTIPQSVLR
jgi:DNA-binding NarL/FixJ family response regulator